MVVVGQKGQHWSPPLRGPGHSCRLRGTAMEVQGTEQQPGISRAGRPEPGPTRGTSTPA